MGAFFLAEFCQNATNTGNRVDGTNGSRIVSVEKSCTDVTMTGNTFRNGGRGAWINQPVNFIMTGNVFINNTFQRSDERVGKPVLLTVDPTCTRSTIEDNLGAKTVQKPVDFNHGRR